MDDPSRPPTAAPPPRCAPHPGAGTLPEPGGERLAGAAPDGVWRPRWDWAEARAALLAADPSLGPALALPLPVRPARTPFGQLVRAICAQQISVLAADAVERRLLAACGGACTPEALSALSEESLRAVGLSRPKATYVRGLAQAAADGALEELGLAALDDEGVITHLTRLPGVGRWTAEMLLIFGLHRPDVLPAGDLGIRAAMALLESGVAAPMPTPKHVLARGEPWRPHRTTASLALWAWRRAARAERAQSAE